MEITIGIWVIPALVTLALYIFTSIKFRPGPTNYIPDVITPIFGLAIFAVGTLAVWLVYFMFLYFTGA